MAYSSTHQPADGRYNSDYNLTNMESYDTTGQANHSVESDYQHDTVGYGAPSAAANHSTIPHISTNSLTGAITDVGTGHQQNSFLFNSQPRSYAINQRSTNQDLFSSSSRDYPGSYTGHYATLPNPSTGTIYDPVHPDRYRGNQFVSSSGINHGAQGAGSAASINHNGSRKSINSPMWPLSNVLPAAVASSSQTGQSYGRQPFAPRMAANSQSTTAQVTSKYGNAETGFATQPGMPTMVVTSLDTLNQESSLSFDQNGLYHTHIQPGQTDPFTEIHASSRGPGMNVLPSQDWRYPPWSGQITDLQSAEYHLWRRRKWTPANAANDRTIPQTEAEILQYARQLYDAMVDFDTGFSDKIQSENKLNRLVNRLYSQLEIEARCYQIVILTKDLHENGSVLLPSSDITFSDPKGKTREDSERAKGSEDWKVRPGAQSERDMSFAERWDQICLSVQESKATATDLLDGKKMYDVIYAPGLCRKVKKSNKQNNDNKQDRLAFAKRAEESGVAVSSSAGNNRRKRARAPEVDEDEYDNGQGPSARKRGR